jgi:hypothetical protein
MGRPVLSGVMVRKSWFDRKVMKSGVIDIGPMSPTVGGVMIALVGWDPTTGDVKILTPWSTWGKRGLGTMTKAAAEDYLFTQDMFSIEAVKMPPSPFRHLANQVESKGRGRRKKTSHSGS